MPNIIGPFDVVFTSMEPIGAHATHLRHLSSDKAAKKPSENSYCISRRIKLLNACSKKNLDLQVKIADKLARFSARMWDRLFSFMRKA